MAWRMFFGFAAGAIGRLPVAGPAAELTGGGRPSLVAASPDELQMTPSPINADWVIQGKPQARVANHSRSRDAWSQTALWDCTAGTFRWHFGWDETVIILEGSVEVTSENGVIKILKAGDIAYFAAGSMATWHVETYVRKLAFLRKPLPASLVFLNSIRCLLTGKKSTPL